MRRLTHDWEAVQRYRDLGHRFVECQQRFGFSHTAWIKAIKRGRLLLPSTPFPERRRKVNWAAVQQYYDAGHTYRECVRQFGFSSGSWTKAVNRGELRARARRRPLGVVLATGDRASVKRHLLEAGILENRCSWCGISEWRGQPISIQIDHINGIRDDNRIENLRMLCPNCHSQTETFAAKNNKKTLRSRVAQLVAAPDSESGGRSFEPNLGSQSGPIV
jgi:hypothetical protein